MTRLSHALTAAENLYKTCAVIGAQQVPDYASRAKLSHLRLRSASVASESELRGNFAQDARIAEVVETQHQGQPIWWARLRLPLTMIIGQRFEWLECTAARAGDTDTIDALVYQVVGLLEAVKGLLKSQHLNFTGTCKVVYQPLSATEITAAWKKDHPDQVVFKSGTSASLLVT